MTTPNRAIWKRVKRMGIVRKDVSCYPSGIPAWRKPSSIFALAASLGAFRIAAIVFTHQSINMTTFLWYFPKAGATLAA